MEEAGEGSKYGWKQFFVKDLGVSVFWFILLAALGLAVGFFGARDLALKYVGKEVNATVLSHDVTGMSHSSDRSYIIDYQFPADGVSQIGSVSSRSSSMQIRYEEGEMMPVRYLEAWPIISGVPDEQEPILSVLIWVFALIPLLGALFILRYLVKCFFRALLGLK